MSYVRQNNKMKGKMIMKKKTAFLFSAILMVSLFLGTVFTSGAADSQTVTMAFTGSWNTLCPLAATADYDDCAANPMFDRLLELDEIGRAHV